ncbi:MAG: 30S ribosomal protein S18, partial [Mariprofundaceae bacterium]
MSEEVKTESAAATGERSAAGSESKQAERRGGQRRGRYPRRRKFCKFCADKSLKIDHKDPELLGQFVTERFKILPARVTGTCSFH